VQIQGGGEADCIVTPNGMVFVKPAVRKSLLAKMLGEILDTRVMIKYAMKGSRNDKVRLQLRKRASDLAHTDSTYSL
jgi:DNA polymerase zeta